MRLFLSLMLLSCGSAPEWPEGGFPYEYRAGCFQVLSETPKDQATLDRNFGLLSDALSSVFDVCSVSAVRIHVLAAYEWGGDDTYGYYDPFAGVTLSRDMAGWAHELLHAKDAGTWGHWGWDTNGYYAAAAKYQNRFVMH